MDKLEFLVALLGAAQALQERHPDQRSRRAARDLAVGFGLAPGSVGFDDAIIEALLFYANGDLYREQKLVNIALLAARIKDERAYESHCVYFKKKVA